MKHYTYGFFHEMFHTSFFLSYFYHFTCEGEGKLWLVYWSSKSCYTQCGEFSSVANLVNRIFGKIPKYDNLIINCIKWCFYCAKLVTLAIFPVMGAITYFSVNRNFFSHVIPWKTFTRVATSGQISFRNKISVAIFIFT